jgi:hypothetical protein
MYTIFNKRAGARKHGDSINSAAGATAAAARLYCVRLYACILYNVHGARRVCLDTWMRVRRACVLHDDNYSFYG